LAVLHWEYRDQLVALQSHQGTDQDDQLELQAWPYQAEERTAFRYGRLRLEEESQAAARVRRTSVVA